MTISTARGALAILAALAIGGLGCAGGEGTGDASPPAEQDVGRAGTDAGAGQELEGGERMKTIAFEVHGMHCDGCVNSIKTALAKQEGVEVESVSLAESLAIVRIDPAKASEEQVATIIRDLGYEAAARPSE